MNIRNNQKLYINNNININKYKKFHKKANVQFLINNVGSKYVFYNNTLKFNTWYLCKYIYFENKIIEHVDCVNIVKFIYFHNKEIILEKNQKFFYDLNNYKHDFDNLIYDDMITEENTKFYGYNKHSFMHYYNNNMIKIKFDYYTNKGEKKFFIYNSKILYL